MDHRVIGFGDVNDGVLGVMIMIRRSLISDHRWSVWVVILLRCFSNIKKERDARKRHSLKHFTASIGPTFGHASFFVAGGVGNLGKLGKCFDAATDLPDGAAACDRRSLAATGRIGRSCFCSRIGSAGDAAAAAEVKWDGHPRAAPLDEMPRTSAHR
jgi:hypothetical protein